MKNRLRKWQQISLLILTGIMVSSFTPEGITIASESNEPQSQTLVIKDSSVPQEAIASPEDSEIAPPTENSEKPQDQSTSLSELPPESATEIESTFTVEDYKKSDASELAVAVRNKQVSSVQLVQFAFQVIEENDKIYNAMISLRKEEAIKEASNLQDTGQPFLGVPLVVKGLGHTISGGYNSNGLLFGKDSISKSTSTFVKAFQNAGFIVIGQTNFPEMGLKNITNSKLYGPTGSAWNSAYQAGGSSGGSATAVAAGYTPIGTGSDAGGSIRIPASWNGIIGFKPSRGVLVGNSASERGQTSHFAETKTMADTRALFDALKNKELPQNTFTKNVKIGYSVKSPVNTQVDPEAIQAVESAVAFLREEGFQVEEVDSPYDGVELMKNYYTIGASSMGIIDYLAKQQAKRPVEIADVDWTTWALFQASKDLTKLDLDQAWENVRKITDELVTFQNDYPLFLTPTTATTAPLLNDTAMLPEHIEQIKHMENRPKEEKLNLIYDQWLAGLTHTPFTQISNLTGTPAISLPTYVSQEGLPLGIQFTTSADNDYLLLDVGDYFENHYGFNRNAAEIPEIPIDKETPIPNESAVTEDAEKTKNGEETKIEPIPDSENQELSKPNLTHKQQLSANNLVIEETKIDLQKNFPKTSEKGSPTFVLIGSFILMTTSGGICLKFIMQKKVETSRTGKRSKTYC